MARTVQARHYGTGQPLTITTEAGLITSVTPTERSPSLWVAPSWFDIQINGCHGIAFNSPNLTPDDVHSVTRECRRHGIGAYLPTLITGPFEDLCHGFATLAQAAQELGSVLAGFHLEGPYLSAEDGPRGAHPKRHCRDPDWDEFCRWQDAAQGRIRMVTLAPERSGALTFIERLTRSGVVVALGHTAATGDQIRDAVSAGARISTHLGNGSHAMLPRHDNYLWEQLAEDRLWASVIADGHHLPPAVLRSIARMKTPGRLVLTCDASSLAGLPAGHYTAWGSELEVLPTGKIVVPGTPFLAGSGCFTDACIATMTRVVGLSLQEAVELATHQPRRLLGLPVPTIAVGQPADFVLFDWEPGGELTVQSMEPDSAE